MRRKMFIPPILSITAHPEEMVVAFGCSRSPKEGDSSIKERYPDLNASDLRIVKSKKGLTTRMSELLVLLRNNSLDLNQKMTLLARMINLHGVLRENGVSIREIKTGIRYKDLYIPRALPPALRKIWTGAVEVTPEGLKRLAQKGDQTAKEMLTYLNNIEKEAGYTYFQYLKDNVHAIIFIPRIGDSLKIFSSDDYWGTAEELSKYVISDTYSEANEEPRETWELVANVIKEAAHIAYYHQPSHSGKFLGDIDTYETYAYTIQSNFLKRLLKAEQRGKIDLNSSQLKQIQNEIECAQVMIREQNFF